MWSKIIPAFVLMFSLVGFAQAQTLPPTDITTLSAEAGNRTVTLTWEAAEDDGFISGYRVYYGTSAVIEENDSYEDDVYTNSTEATYTVGNLLNGVEYFFSVTAIDDDQMESINYSNEASATPLNLDGNDTEGPKVISATHTSPREVTVVMSESIAETDPSSFLLSDQETFEEILIDSIRFNSENLILTLPIDSLLPGTTYDLTATSAVEDLVGNPVSSGITDTVSFTAVADFPEDEPVVIPVEDPEPIIEPETEDEPIVDVIDDNFDEFEDLFSEIDDEPVLDEDEPAAPDDEDDNDIDPEKSSAPDTVPPLEAQNLNADTSQVENSNQVVLSWTPAMDLDNDIADQVLYTRTGLGAWDEGYSLGTGVSQTVLDVQPNQNYQVRLVTIDNNGNESQGAAFSFSTNLAQSGPGTVIALSAALLVGMMLLLSSRRRA